MSDGSEASRVIALLRSVRREPANLPNVITALQHMVWKSKGWESDLSTDVIEVLRTLAYDLDYFEPDPTERETETSYFGVDRAIQMIADALARIDAGREP